MSESAKNARAVEAAAHAVRDAILAGKGLKAFKKGSADVANALVSVAETKNLGSVLGEQRVPLLFVAALTNDVLALRILLDASADVKTVCGEFTAPLVVLLNPSTRALDCLRLLAEHKADFGWCSPTSGMGALFLALKQLNAGDDGKRGDSQLDAKQAEAVVAFLVEHKACPADMPVQSAVVLGQNLLARSAFARLVPSLGVRFGGTTFAGLFMSLLWTGKPSADEGKAALETLMALGLKVIRASSPAFGPGS